MNLIIPSLLLTLMRSIILLKSDALLRPSKNSSFLRFVNLRCSQDVPLFFFILFFVVICAPLPHRQLFFLFIFFFFFHQSTRFGRLAKIDSSKVDPRRRGPKSLVFYCYYCQTMYLTDDVSISLSLSPTDEKKQNKTNSTPKRERYKEKRVIHFGG